MRRTERLKKDKTPSGVSSLPHAPVLKLNEPPVHEPDVQSPMAVGRARYGCFTRVGHSPVRVSSATCMSCLVGGEQGKETPNPCQHNRRFSCGIGFSKRLVLPRPLWYARIMSKHPRMPKDHQRPFHQRRSTYEDLAEKARRACPGGDLELMDEPDDGFRWLAANVALVILITATLWLGGSVSPAAPKTTRVVEQGSTTPEGSTISLGTGASK